MKLSLATLRLIHRANRAAPVLCLAALLAGGTALSRQTGDRGEAVARAQSIRMSLEQVPFMTGRWVGTDCPLPAAATEILMPTAVLSRRFVELGTGRHATLGVIHCGDVRDMNGHYPPSCYPSSGWHAREGGHDSVALELNGERFRATLYRFSSVDGTGALREVSVIGFFVLPDAAISSDIEQLRSRVAKLEISRLGVGQIQVVMDGWPAADDVAATANELLALIPSDCVRALKGLPVAQTEAIADTDPKTDGMEHTKLHGVSQATSGDEP